MKKSNRLAYETSPYLKQHAQNPVDWYPWGAEALSKSKKEQKPIFLSIGYSACHWCHVMERESFEDQKTADVMNHDFVSIKVDREERPDLDHIYMSAVQLMTQHGGWPMSVFLTPDLEPFYGGTYFPPEDRMGLPSFQKVLHGVANAWKTKRGDLNQSAKQITLAIEQMNAAKSPGALDYPEILNNAFRTTIGNFDPYYGGFGTQPKFFHTMDLRLCLGIEDEKAVKIVTTTLDHLAAGGIYDHLGGGFHRYSTDQKWLVPHFEKMLYDNALLTEVFLEAYQLTHQTHYARVARETLNYVIREMTSSEGAFFSTQDADSEGVEGKYYVWSLTEVEEILDPDVAKAFIQAFSVTRNGNWENQNILNIEKPLAETAKNFDMDYQWFEETLNLAKRKLLAERQKRIVPFRDEKILVSWNALMIHAMALGYQILRDETYLHAAQSAAKFLDVTLTDEEGQLHHSYHEGRKSHPAFLDDYASLILAFATLYESDFDSSWTKIAMKYADKMISEFWDETQNVFYFTGKNSEKLVIRPKETYDGATPSGSAMAVTALARLGRLMQDSRYTKIAESALQTHASTLQMAPSASGQWLLALSFLRKNPKELVLVKGSNEDDFEQALSNIRQTYLPNKIVVTNQKDATNPNLSGKKSLEGEVTLYLCEGFSCQKPVVGCQGIQEALKAALS